MNLHQSFPWLRSSQAYFIIFWVPADVLILKPLNKIFWMTHPIPSAFTLEPKWWPWDLDLSNFGITKQTASRIRISAIVICTHFIDTARPYENLSAKMFNSSYSEFPLPSPFSSIVQSFGSQQVCSYSNLLTQYSEWLIQYLRPFDSIPEYDEDLHVSIAMNFLRASPTSLFTGIVHHLCGPSRRAHTQAS